MAASLVQRIKDAKALFVDIENGKIEQVKEFIAKYPGYTSFTNARKESPVAVSLKKIQIDIYALLVTHGFKLTETENLEDVTRKANGEANPKKLKTLFDVHKEIAINPSSKYLLNLLARIRFHNVKDSKRLEYYELVVKAFGVLNEIERIRPVLHYVSCFDRFIIVFDFDCDTVGSFDPRIKNDVYGVTYGANDCIAIGAKGLVDNENSFRVYGTLIHELTHLATDFLYQNDRKPYNFDDEERLREYYDIVKACKTLKDVDDIIDRVYEGKQADWEMELIVRPPQLLAFYKNNPENLKIIEEKLENLFNFFDKRLIADVKIQISRVEDEQKVRELNNFCGALWLLEASQIFFETIPRMDLSAKGKVKVLSSNCAHLTMVSIYQKLRAEKNFSSFVLVKLEMLKNDTIFNMTLDALDLRTKPSLIIDCGSEKEEKIAKICRNYQERGEEERIILVKSDEIKILKLPFKNFQENQLIHVWSNLKASSQEKLLKVEVNFQGHKTSLKKILGDNQETFQHYHLLPLNDLVMEHEIKIGDELSFPEIDFHMDRKFVTGHINSPDTLSFIEMSVLTDYEEIGKVVLISDEPGMGKTYELKVISRKLKQIYKESWVVYVDLKTYTDCFDKRSIKFGNSREISEFFTEKILKVNDYSAKVFEFLFTNNKTILLIDGVDEICPSFKDFVIDLMSGIKKLSKNQLWIATRPHVLKELKEELGTHSYRLKPFDDSERREFCKKCLQLKIQDKNKITQTIQNLDKFLGPEFFQMRVGFSVGPLLLRMFVEVFIDNAEINLLNLNTLYKSFVEKMLRRFFKKGPEAESEMLEYASTSSNIHDFHYQKAFKVIFNDSLQVLIQKCFKQTKPPTIQQMQRVGLMFVDKDEKFYFIHQSFAEFFCAEFVFQKVFVRTYQSSQEIKHGIKIFQLMLKNTEFAFSRATLVSRFLEVALENLASERKENFRHELKEIFRELDENGKLFGNLLHCGLFQFVKAFAETFAHDKNELLELWSGRKYKKRSIFMETIFKNTGHFDELWDFCKGFFSDQQMKNLIMQENEFELIPFHYKKTITFFAADGDHEELLKIITNLKTFLPESEFHNLLVPNDESNRHFLVDLMLLYGSRQSSQFDNFDYKKIFLKKFEAFKEIFSRETMKLLMTSNGHTGLSLVQAATLNSYEHVEVIMKELNNVMDANECMKTLTNKTDDGITTLMLAAGSSVPNIIKFIEELRNMFDDQHFSEQLLQEDNSGMTVIHHAALSKNIENFKFIANLYKTKFKKEEIFNVISKEINENKNLFMKVFQNSPVENFQEFWNFCQEILEEKQLIELLMKDFGDEYDEDDEDDEAVICIDENFHILKSFIFNSYQNCSLEGKVSLTFLVVQWAEFEMVQEFWPKVLMDVQNNLSNFTNGKRESILFSAMKNEDNSVLQFIIESLKNIMDDISFNNLLTSKDSEGNTFLMHGIAEKRRLLNDDFLEVFEKVLNATEIKTCLLANDSLEKNILFHMMHYDDERLRNIIKYLQNHLEENEIWKLFEEKTKDEENIFMMAAFKSEKESFEELWNFAEKNSNGRSMVSFLKQKSKENLTVLHFSSINNEQTFYAVKIKYEGLFSNWEIQEILKGTCGQHILFHSMKSTFSDEVFAFMEKILDVPEIQTILMNMNEAENESFFQAITQKKTSVAPIFFFAAEFLEENFFKELFLKIENISGKEIMQFIFQQKNENFEDIVDVATRNTMYSVLIFLKEKYEVIMGKKKIM